MSANTPTGAPPLPTTSSAYPLPPMRYINIYTDDNVANGSIPLPPKPITEGQYSMFGQNIALDDAIIRSLESQGLRRLYPRDYEHKKELKKINASILVNFLDLLDVLVRCPDTNKREEKCFDIQLLFITMHHLINELRPHQARETIRVWLKAQKEQRDRTAYRLNHQITRVNDIINSGINCITDSVANMSTGDASDSNNISADNIDKSGSSGGNTNNVNNGNHAEDVDMNGCLSNDFKVSITINNSENIDPNSSDQNIYSGIDSANYLSDDNRQELDALMCNFVDEI